MSEGVQTVDQMFAAVKPDGKCNCRSREPSTTKPGKCSYCGGTIPADYIHKPKKERKKRERKSRRKEDE